MKPHENPTRNVSGRGPAVNEELAAIRLLRRALACQFWGAGEPVAGADSAAAGEAAGAGVVVPESLGRPC